MFDLFVINLYNCEGVLLNNNICNNNHIIKHNIQLSITQVMERLEPFGYVSAHPENKFPILTSGRSNLLLECTVQHSGKIQKVKCISQL